MPLENTQLDACSFSAWRPWSSLRWRWAFRQGELLGLQCKDVDLDREELFVLHALERVTGQGLVLVDVKTDLSRRVLGLPSIVAAALRVHRDRQALDRMLAGTRWRDTGFVFTTTRGTPLNGTEVTHRFKR